MSNNIYKAGKAGGLIKIALPKESEGKEYERKIWKDGTIVFKEVKA